MRALLEALRVLLLPVAAALLLVPAVAAQSDTKEKEKASADFETVKLRIEVTATEKNIPVDSASVYAKFQKERMLAKDKMIEMNVKTNREGVAKLPAVPRGKVLIQVIAPGWKTFGQWYDLNEAEQTIKINLQKPPRWY
jgi:hypothetical protein